MRCSLPIREHLHQDFQEHHCRRRGRSSRDPLPAVIPVGCFLVSGLPRLHSLGLTPAVYQEVLGLVSRGELTFMDLAMIKVMVGLIDLETPVRGPMMGDWPLLAVTKAPAPCTRFTAGRTFGLGKRYPLNAIPLTDVALESWHLEPRQIQAWRICGLWEPQPPAA